MKNIIRAIVIAPLALFSACAHKQSFTDLSAWNEEPGKSVQLSLRSLKDKASKADLMVAVKNNYPFPVIVSEGSIHYSRAGDEGVTQEGNARRILNPGDSASFLIHYQFAGKEKGAGVLKIENLFAGKTVEVEGTTGKAKLGVGVIGGAGFGKAKLDTNHENYVRRSATEGDALPSATLSVPGGA